MRCASVAVVTRNACAISSVVSPHTSRKGERDLRLGRKRGMTAGEDEPKTVVLHLVDGPGLFVGAPASSATTRPAYAACSSTSATADDVDGLEATRRHEPGTRLVPGTPVSGHVSSAAAKASCMAGLLRRARGRRRASGSTWPGFCPSPTGRERRTMRRRSGARHRRQPELFEDTGAEVRHGGDRG